MSNKNGLLVCSSLPAEEEYSVAEKYRIRGKMKTTDKKSAQYNLSQNIKNLISPKTAFVSHGGYI